MRIGIITFWETQDNYGQILQNYALQQILKKMGHHPFLIKYSLFRDWCYDYPGRWRNVFDIKRLLTYLKRILKGDVNPSKRNMTTTPVDREFNEFKKKYLEATKDIYNLDMLRENPPDADIYICGSDMIWYCPDNYYIYRKLLHAYFLGFGSPEKKRIAYAASFGRTEFPAGYYDIVRNDFKKLDAVSVRENMGLQVCEKLGRKDAIHVLDPTCLLNSEDYSRIIVKPKDERPFMFIYIVGKRPVDMQEIVDYAHENGLKIVYSGSQLNDGMGVDDDIIEIVYPTIQEWIGYMACSKMVVTNSFHGTVFSVIFKKENIVLTNNKNNSSGSNTRMISFLNSIGLDNRIYDGNLKKLLMQPIEWKSVDEKLESQINRSMHYLNTSINS